MEALDKRSVIAHNEFGTYSIPASATSRPAAKAVIAGAVWEKPTVAFMRKHAGAKDIVHAGAFFGDFLPALSAALHSTARIWAFEPNPENFHHAQQTMALNDIKNVELRMAGLGETSDRRKLLVTRRTGLALGGASRFVESRDPVAKEELLSAEIVRIDDAVPSDRNVGIVQLDLEGYEFKALQGAKKTIERCRPLVIFEVNQPTARCVKLLAALNYKIAGMVGPNLLLVPTESGWNTVEPVE